MPIRRVAVVLNCRSGAFVRCGDPENALQESFTRRGLEPIFIKPSADRLFESILEAAKSHPDAIVVAGGDGTLACAAAALMQSAIPLGILPCGTMNLLAKDLSLPINDIEAAIGIIAAGHVREVDVGTVNDSVFLCASMLGLPARLGRTRERSRGSIWRTWIRMMRATWRHMLRARRLNITMTADGQTISSRAAAVTITVNPIADSSGRNFGRTALDGGAFGLYTLKSFGFEPLRQLLFRVFFRQPSPAVFERTVREIDIRSNLRAMRVMNDGELKLLTPPLRYRIRQRALRVLVR